MGHIFSFATFLQTTFLQTIFLQTTFMLVNIVHKYIPKNFNIYKLFISEHLQWHSLGYSILKSTAKVIHRGSMSFK